MTSASLNLKVGELEGTFYREFAIRYSYATLDKFEGAETIEALQERAASAFDYLRSRPETKILIVSHSCFGRAFKRVIDGKPYTDEFVDNTRLTHGELQLIYEAA